MKEPGGPDSALEAYVEGPPPEPAARRRRPLATVAAAVGVAVALVAGVLALAALNGDGSGSPEDAVRRLVTAVEQEDVLGALEALVPGERDVARDRLVALVAELRRLGVAAEDLDLGRVAGLDVGVEGLELTTEALDDDVAAVLVTGGKGRLTVVDAAALAGPVIDRYLEGAERVDVPSPPPAPLAGLRLVAVRQDGRWFVSLGYSAAEAARRSAGAPLPRFDRAVAPRGASSPEDVVRELAKAASALDLRRLVELTAPGEGAALHAYAPLFLPMAELRAGALRNEGFAIDVPTLELSTVRSKETTRVIVDRLEARVTSADGDSTVEYDGRCVSFTTPTDDEPFRLCADDVAFAPGQEAKVALSVVERDGAWYVSPVGTYFDGALDAMRQMDRAAMEDTISRQGAFALLRFISLVPFGFLPSAGAGEGASREVTSGAASSIEETCVVDPREAGGVLCQEGVGVPARPVPVPAPGDAPAEPGGATTETGNATVSPYESLPPTSTIP